MEEYMNEPNHVFITFSLSKCITLKWQN